MGWLIGIPVLSGAIFRLPLGIATDKWGGRIVFGLLLVFSAVPMYLVSYCNTYWQFLCGWSRVWLLWHELCGRDRLHLGVVSPASARYCPGHLRGGQRRGGPHQPRRSTRTQLAYFQRRATRRLADAAEDLCGHARRHGDHLPANDEATIGRWQPREDDAATTGTAPPHARVAVRAVLLFRLWRVRGAGPVVGAILRQCLLDEVALAGALAACNSLPSGVIRAMGGWMSDRWGARTVMYWVLGSSLVCCALLLIVPQMDIRAPGSGIMASAAGTVLEVNGQRDRH